MERQTELLDCTIRDGNYAVNFKFTEHDTRTLTKAIARLGFRWIEVGHGLGLGGTEAGKGEMVASDADLIRAAREVAGDAKIGVFFIPGIGNAQHLEEARDAGLDFIRIGYNASQIVETFPFVEQARSLGLIPCVNMMKTYGVSPTEFAELARQCADAGAEVVYCVDSAGSMFPRDVRAYFTAAREKTDCRLGFHGHNNLMMVIANCVAAHDCGVEFLDVTLAGLGRSAGNAPSEILVAVLKRLNVETGIDLFEVMDAVDSYMWPLVSRVRPHDMLGVAGGYAQFHSSFLPKVAAAARQSSAELRRLIVRVAEHDPVDLDTDYLEKAAADLAGSDQLSRRDELISFQSGSIEQGTISTSLRSVEDLVSALAAASAKNPGSQSALHLVPSKVTADEFVTADFVYGDDKWIIGRAVYGSMESLNEVLKTAWPRIGYFLVSCPDGWSQEARQTCRRLVDPDRVITVRDDEIKQLHLLEVFDDVLGRDQVDEVLVYGMTPAMEAVLARQTHLQALYVYDPSATPAHHLKNAIPIRGWQDWPSLKLSMDLIVCGTEPDEAAGRHLARILKPGGTVLVIQAFKNKPAWINESIRVIRCDWDVAYAGALERNATRVAFLGQRRFDGTAE